MKHVDRVIFAGALGVLFLLTLLAPQPAAQTGEPSRDQSFPEVKKAGDVERPKTPGGDASEQKADPQTPLPVLELTADVTLRALRTAESAPVAELKKGTLVLKRGDGSHGFVPVAVPGGFPGYVHHAYLTVGGDGIGTTTGSNVSFRQRPVAGEAPLDHLRKEARLPALAREGDWWRVLSNDEVIAWAPEGSLQPVARDAALETKLAAQIRERQAAWLEANKAREATAKRAGQIEQIGSALKEARSQYDAERQAAGGDVLKENLERFEQLGAALASMVEKAGAAEEPIAAQIAAFRKEVESRKTVQAAMKVLAEKPKPIESPKEAPVPSVPPRRRFEAVGWLEYRPGMRDYSAFRLMKGGDHLYYLTCSSGRYDLRDFVGREVGVRGSVSRPSGADVRVIDVERLVILAGR